VETLALSLAVFPVCRIQWAAEFRATGGSCSLFGGVMRVGDVQLIDGMRAISEIGIDAVEQEMLKHEQSECHVIHHFGPGLCIREVHMKAGALVVGHAHKTDHVNVMLSGRLLMLKDDGSTQEYVAPMMYIGKPGRKVAHIIDDVVWQNIFATDSTDIEEIESIFLDKSESFSDHQIALVMDAIASRDIDRVDYANMLKSFGISEKDARLISEFESDQVGFGLGTCLVKTGPSSIEGVGLFATADIKSGELICPARVGGMRTPAGRYTNHAKHPNAKMQINQIGDVDLIALRDIHGCKGGMDGEEITIDYRSALALSGVHELEVLE
jgi:hypothetical protein